MITGQNGLEEMRRELGKDANEFGHYILTYILKNDYAVQYRPNLDSDKWQNCTFRDLVKGILNFRWDDRYQSVFDTHSMHFYRIRPNEAPRQDKYLKITDQILQVKEN